MIIAALIKVLRGNTVPALAQRAAAAGWDLGPAALWVARYRKALSIGVLGAGLRGAHRLVVSHSAAVGKVDLAGACDVEQLERLVKLKEAGSVSEEDFVMLKARIVQW